MSTTCDGCIHAEWKRTKTGRLHPDKSGRCLALKVWPLDLTIPVAFYWFGLSKPPSPSGGWIKRGTAHSSPCSFHNKRTREPRQEPKP